MLLSVRISISIIISRQLLPVTGVNGWSLLLWLFLNLNILLLQRSHRPRFFCSARLFKAFQPQFVMHL
jgi:hypothetical protein